MENLPPSWFERLLHFCDVPAPTHSGWFLPETDLCVGKCYLRKSEACQVRRKLLLLSRRVREVCNELPCLKVRHFPLTSFPAKELPKICALRFPLGLANLAETQLRPECVIIDQASFLHLRGQGWVSERVDLRCLRELTFDDNADVTCEDWPSALQSLAFGKLFNRPLNAGLAGIRSLSLGFRFNQPLVSQLPETLTFLKIVGDFDQPLGQLPRGLRTLIIGGEFNQHIAPGDLPECLAVLRLLTPKLTPALQEEALPRALLRLQLHGDNPLPRLPADVETLILDHRFNFPVAPGYLPNSLRSLVVPQQYTRPLREINLPDSLHKLTFIEYNVPLVPGDLPTGLRQLDLGERYSHELFPDVLPLSLEILKVSPEYNSPLTPGSLPESLQRLEFKSYNLRNIPPGALPSQCRAFFPRDLM